MIVNTPDKLPVPWDAFLAPLSHQVWFTIIMFLIYASLVMMYLENQYGTYVPFKRGDYFRHFQRKYQRLQKSPSGKAMLKSISPLLNQKNSIAQVIQRLTYERDSHKEKVLQRERAGLPPPSPLPFANGGQGLFQSFSGCTVSIDKDDDDDIDFDPVGLSDLDATITQNDGSVTFGLSGGGSEIIDVDLTMSTSSTTSSTPPPSHVEMVPMKNDSGVGLRVGSTSSKSPGSKGRGFPGRDSDSFSMLPSFPTSLYQYTQKGKEENERTSIKEAAKWRAPQHGYLASCVHSIKSMATPHDPENGRRAVIQWQNWAKTGNGGKSVPLVEQHRRAKHSSNLSCSRPFPFLLSMGHSLFTGFLTFVGDPNAYPNSMPGRFFLVCWLFGMLIINNTYTASLASFLTAQSLKVEVENIQQVVEQQLKVGTYDSIFPRAVLGTLGVSRGQFVTGLQTTDEIIHSLKTGQTDVHIEVLPYALNLLANDCDLVITRNGATFTEGALAFPVQTGHVLYDDLRIAFTAANGALNFREGYEAVLAEYKLQQDLVCEVKDDSIEELQAVGIESFGFFFAMLFASGMLAVFFRWTSERLRNSEWMEQYYLSTLEPMEQMQLGIRDDFCVRYLQTKWKRKFAFRRERAEERNMTNALKRVASSVIMTSSSSPVAVPPRSKNIMTSLARPQD
jgi:hypothetical protein